MDNNLRGVSWLLAGFPVGIICAIIEIYASNGIPFFIGCIAFYLGLLSIVALLSENYEDELNRILPESGIVQHMVLMLLAGVLFFITIFMFNKVLG